MIHVGLLGKAGRMGQWVTRLLEEEFSGRARLTASIGKGDSLDPLFECDVIIDFSLPEAAAAAVEVSMKAKRTKPAWVIGSTGWTAAQRESLEKLANVTPVLMSSNFSTGVLALAEILDQASPLLKKLGYTPVLVDTHHRHKKDSPSGTALMLQKVISPASPSSVQTQSVRAGEIVGDHEVTFYGPGDHLTLGHFAQDRSVFARGAIEAALWLVERRSNLSATGEILGMTTFFREKFLGS